MYTLLLYVHVLALVYWLGAISAHFFPADTCFAATSASSPVRPLSRS